MRCRRIAGVLVGGLLLNLTGCCWWCDRWCARPVSAYPQCVPLCCSSSPVTTAAAPPAGPSYIPPQAVPSAGQSASWTNPQGTAAAPVLYRQPNGCYCPQ